MQKAQLAATEVGAYARPLMLGAAMGDGLALVVDGMYNAQSATSVLKMTGDVDAFLSNLSVTRQFMFGKKVVTLGREQQDKNKCSTSVNEAMALACAEMEEAAAIGDKVYMSQIKGVMEALTSIHTAACAIYFTYLPILRASLFAIEEFKDAVSKAKGEDKDALEEELLATLAAHRAALPPKLPEIKEIMPYGFDAAAVPERFEQRMGFATDDAYPAAAVAAVTDHSASAYAIWGEMAVMRAKTIGKTVL